MKSKKILLFFTGILISCSCYAQKEYVDRINRYDERGKKTGYWIEYGYYGRVEAYYKDGIRNGNYKDYNKDGHLLALGEFTNNEYSGTWYLFGDKGHLISISDNFQDNHDIAWMDDNTKYLHKYKCYHKTYHPNGAIKSEGWLLWTDGPEMDDVIEYGEWKFYDESGEQVEAKILNVVNE